MKQTLGIVLALAVGFTTAILWMNREPAAPVGAPLVETAGLPGEKPATANGSARPHVNQTAAPEAALTPEPAAAPVRRSPQELLEELASLQITPGPGQPRAQYRVLTLLDQLAQWGATALPALRQFLASGRDVDYNPTAGGNRGGARNSLLPPSLRLGLFDVVRQIGGPDAEGLLAEALSLTTRGTELTYLGQLLEELSPDRHASAVLTAARNLLTGGKVTDPSERNQLYEVLLQAGDTSLIGTAQAGLIQADGKVDGSALRYLQRALGEKSLALAAQTYQDPRVTDANSKEALGRLALGFVGAQDQALELFHQAMLDPQLKPDQRRELVEDLNQDGLGNRKTPTPEDLKIIAKRYALTQSYLQQDYVKNDRVLNAAFLEANKDLAKMLERAARQ